MSSMRNAVQRRNHKERAQPKEREKWGVLEKHKVGFAIYKDSSVAMTDCDSRIIPFEQPITMQRKPA